MAVKRKDHEKLDDANVARVIALLEADKPITKKQAYEELNISANSTRLQKIIEEYKEKQERTARFRAQKRGKPASPQEVQEVISDYLSGRPVSEIADGLYRSPTFVKAIIDNVGVPNRSAGDYFKPEILPEQCISETFEKGQVVWAAKYNAQAIVLKESKGSKADNRVYDIYVIETIEEPSPYFPHMTDYGGRYAAQPACELGSLEHLKAHGVDVYKPLRPYFQNMLAGR